VFSIIQRAYDYNWDSARDLERIGCKTSNIYGCPSNDEEQHIIIIIRSVDVIYSTVIIDDVDGNSPKASVISYFQDFILSDGHL
jgi:hypothetical protein